MKQAGDYLELNGKNYVVITTFSANGNNYSFLNEVDLETNDIKDSFYFIKYKADESYDVVTDDQEIQSLNPALQKSIKQEFIKNGMDIDARLKEETWEVRENE